MQQEIAALVVEATAGRRHGQGRDGRPEEPEEPEARARRREQGRRGDAPGPGGGRGQRGLAQGGRRGQGEARRPHRRHEDPRGHEGRKARSSLPLDYPAPVARLIDELRRLPGIGPKSAQRIAFHLLRGAREDTTRLATAVGALFDGIRLCARLQRDHGRRALRHLPRPRPLRAHRSAWWRSPTTSSRSRRPATSRAATTSCTARFRPCRGWAPTSSRSRACSTRIGAGGVEEVILATSPTVEGEATAVYLARILKPLGCGSPASPWGCPWAPTSSGPTRSPWPRHSRAGGNTEHRPGQPRRRWICLAFGL